MPLFSFIGHTLTELSGKTGKSQQMYKQSSLTFYTSKVCLKRVEKKKLLGCNNKDISLKIGEGSHFYETAIYFFWKNVFLKFRKI